MARTLSGQRACAGAISTCIALGKQMLAGQKPWGKTEGSVAASHPQARLAVQEH